MEKQLFFIYSVNHALKAQRALSKYGIASHISRSSNYRHVKSCGYVIEIFASYEKSMEILNHIGVSVTPLNQNGGAKI